MIQLTTEELKQKINEGENFVLDLYATWCGPCKALIPRLEALSSEYPDVTFVKVNVDENTDSALELGIRSVPTLVMLDENIEVKRMTGVKTTKELEAWAND